jgi:poly(hydroxyalkanoate) granule-associated protein
MAKKTLKKKAMKGKAVSKAKASKLAEPVLGSAREIWLAGLGALSVAQAEGNKVVKQGSKLFEQLVAEGAKLEKSNRKLADAGAAEVKSKLSGVRGEVEQSLNSARKQVEDNWDKLESIFEQRVARVMGRLGVPTADDLHKLAGRVGALSDKVAELNRQTSARVAVAKPASDAETAVFHLLPDGDNWAVRREGEDADLSVHGTKKPAMDSARGIAQAAEPSRLVVHRADGTIQTTYNYGDDA